MKKLGTLVTTIGAAALALLPVFNAQAETPAHPLVDPYTGATAYRGTLTGAIQNSGVPRGDLLGRSAVVQLEKALKSPRPTSQTVYAPETLYAGMPQVVIAVPPKNADSYASIPVCLEGADGSIIAKWNITASGKVIEDKTRVGQLPQKTLCESWQYPQTLSWSRPVQ